jgi:hypothetical protein
VGHRTNWVEKAIHPWDSLFYLAYEGIAAKGNCFGMSLEGALAQTSRSLYGEPVHRFAFDAGLRASVNQKHGYQIGDASIRWTLWKLASLDALHPKAVYENVRAAIARRDPPLLSMFDVDGFRGHTVLAYECPPVAAGKPLVIRVADPNHPYTADATAEHPTWIEIDPAADTFKFVTPNGVKFRSSRIAGGYLPGTVMFETPLSQVAGQPRTPLWEFAALLAALGGLLVLAGDAEAVEFTADGTSLYHRTPDGTAVAAGGARGWMRIPLLDQTLASPPQLFANASHATSRLELTLRGRGAGGCRQYLRTARHAVLLESPTSIGRTDTFRMVRDSDTPMRAELDTTGPGKDVTLGVGTILDAGRGDSAGALVKLGAAPGMTAFAEALADGSGVVIRSAGASRPVELELERTVGNRAQRVAITIPAAPAGEVVMVRPADVVSPLGEMHVRRVAADGQPIGAAPERVQPRALDPRRSSIVVSESIRHDP